MRDSRLIGSTAENIFLSLLNEQGIFATSFDTAAFDGIVYDSGQRFFRVGESPYYVQIKCRGSEGDWFNPQGHAPKIAEKMQELARSLHIPEASLYFVAGFFKNSDIRTVIYYCVPLDLLARFRTSSQYRFSVGLCEEAVEEEETIFKL